ncbi:MAG TPA: tRNA lysidine(34) synthetase TilS [Thermoanaerobaculia bacterium]|nr:tRNA lysidine(34) synthetase TilS [Thermoanaerobaculia bacterium]
MDIVPILEGFFQSAAPLAADDRVVVAFSGGPDSTALLLAMSRLARRAGGPRLVAAHLDHGMDAGSADRAAAAARLAAALEVPAVLVRRPVPALRQPGESLEAAARRVRYDFLDEVRRLAGARYVATAHHRDDQAETVLLRLAFGTGVAGLAGIRPVHGTVVRPLLGPPGVTRNELAALLAEAGLKPVEDPTNRDPHAARSRVRHHLLPRLAADVPDLSPRLAGLAARALRVGDRLERILEVERAGGTPAYPGGASVEREVLERLPAELLPFALALLHRRAGVPYPAARAARSELLRQLGRPGRIACDCGDGWVWREEDGRVALRRREEAGSPLSFTYTLKIPGELEIPEVALRVRLICQPVEPWMLAGCRRRAALALPVAPGDRVTVRSRCPGDRLHPLGASGSRKLKDVLIDRRVPRGERDRLPLLCVGGQIAWVPGVTIDQRFRLTGEPTAWVAEITTR